MFFHQKARFFFTEKKIPSSNFQFHNEKKNTFHKKNVFSLINLPYEYHKCKVRKWQYHTLKLHKDEIILGHIL